MRIITTVVALFLAVANVNAQETMKENVDLIAAEGQKGIDEVMIV